MNAETSQTGQTIEGAIIRSWWVILFMLGCYLSYEQGLQKKDLDFNKLHTRYIDLQRKKTMLMVQQENLNRQINSQSDPAWVELVLMKGLGLTPEGQTKVLFTNQMDLIERYKHGFK